MKQAPIDSVVESRLRTEAREVAGWRVAVVVGAWGVAHLLVALLLPTWLAAGTKIVLDAALSAATWWGLTPGRRKGGSEFMRADHWTKLLVIPLILGMVLALGGAWRLLHGMG
jgi:hypothetical protein